MSCRRRILALVAVLVLSGCASGSLRDAKNAYNQGDFATARSTARRLSDDPQARLIAARAGARLLGEGERADSAALAAVAVDLRAAARGYPFPEEWANRELAAGFADWLMRAGLPELADLYYRAGLEAAGEDPEPAEQVLAEGALQAGSSRSTGGSRSRTSVGTGCGTSSAWPRGRSATRGFPIRPASPTRLSGSHGTTAACVTRG